MVRIAVCYPFYSKVLVYKDGKKKAYKVSLGFYHPNTPYKPWEANYKQIIEYLEAVKSKSSQPFDYLIAILDNNYRNRFRKQFTEISASWKFGITQIIDPFHLSLFGAICDLKMEPKEKELLWEISLFREHIRCKIWYYRFDEWNLHTTISQPKDTESLTAEDLQRLQLKLKFSSFPNIVLHHFNRKQQSDFCKVFPYLRKAIHKHGSHDPCKLALKYGRGLADEYSHEKYHCKIILNRLIQVKTGKLDIIEFDQFREIPTLPFHRYIPEKRDVIEIYECGYKTAVIEFEKCSKVEFMIKIDRNGIFYIFAVDVVDKTKLTNVMD